MRRLRIPSESAGCPGGRRERVKRILVPGLIALAAGAIILAVGGASVEVGLLATIAAGVFADLARRAGSEAMPARNDPTDLASSVAFFALLVAAAFDLRRTGPGAEQWLARGAGLAIIAAGMVLRARAARALGESFSVRLGVRDDHTLVDRGPYRWIRHPDYAALLLVACGTALALSSPLALGVAAGLWLPVIVMRIAREERMMVERFDARYRAYVRRTWRLIVGIY